MTTITHPLYLHFNGVEQELDAVWEITADRYPAEPYSHGGGRGMETETDARLVSWERNGVLHTRDEAVSIAGEAAVRRQEAWVAECGGAL